MQKERVNVSEKVIGILVLMIYNIILKITFPNE